MAINKIYSKKFYLSNNYRVIVAFSIILVLSCKLNAQAILTEGTALFESELEHMLMSVDPKMYNFIKVRIDPFTSPNSKRSPFKECIKYTFLNDSILKVTFGKHTYHAIIKDYGVIPYDIKTGIPPDYISYKTFDSLGFTIVEGIYMGRSDTTRSKILYDPQHRIVNSTYQYDTCTYTTDYTYANGQLTAIYQNILSNGVSVPSYESHHFSNSYLFPEKFTDTIISINYQKSPPLSDTTIIDNLSYYACNALPLQIAKFEHWGNTTSIYYVSNLELTYKKKKHIRDSAYRVYH